MITGLFQKQAPNPYGDLSAEDQKSLNDFNASFYAGPDYKGRHETGQFLDSQYANLLRQFAQMGPIDQAGEASIGNYYNNARDRISAGLAARGIGGSGIEGGAIAGSYGSEGQSVADYIRQLTGQRDAQKYAALSKFNDLTYSLGAQGLQRNIQAQYNKGGFWKDLLGVAGSVGGALLGGPTGAAIGKGITNRLTGGGGAAPYTGSEPYGSYGGGYGQGIDYNAYDGPWQPDQYVSGYAR